MYNVQMLSERIKERAKNKGIKLKEMLPKCDLNVNFVSQISDRTGAIALAKIADYLDCSVDYLLGRTDNPNSTGPNITNNEQSNINGNNNINVNTAVPDQKDNLTEQFLQKFQQLDFDDKVDVMQYVKNKNNTV